MQAGSAHTKVRSSQSRTSRAKIDGIHRPDTAASVTHLAKLVRDAQNLPNEVRILDLCTGTGCIPLLFRHEFAAKRKDVDLRIIGIDISDKSLGLAHHNLRKNEIGNEARNGMTNFAKADVLTNPFGELVPGAPFPVRNVLNYNKWSPFWDILISNPPYISPSAYWKTTMRSVRKYEPKLALVPPPRSEFDDTQQGDMFYPRLLKIAQEVEAKVVLLEVADLEQALRVAQLAQKLDVFDGIEIWRDDPGTSSQPTSEDGFEVFGEGHGRSVVCWRGVGGSWLGKTFNSQPHTAVQHASSQKSLDSYLPRFEFDTDTSKLELNEASKFAIALNRLKESKPGSGRTKWVSAAYFKHGSSAGSE
jgi:methylase of polypeptide subunit release factors